MAFRWTTQRRFAVSLTFFFCGTFAGLVILGRYGITVPPLPSPPPPSSASTLPPSLQANSTFLQATCDLACGPGAVCNATSQGLGANICLTCGSNYTMVQPTNVSCLDLSYCYQWAFCIDTNTTSLQTIHRAIANVTYTWYARTNQTFLPLNASLLASPYWSVLSGVYDQLASNGLNQTRDAIDVAQLSNTWLIALAQTVRRGDKRSAELFFDDSLYQTLSGYQAVISGTFYATYLRLLKQRVCTLTWVPGTNGNCVPPPTSQGHSGCYGLTASEVAQVNGICLWN